MFAWKRERIGERAFLIVDRQTAPENEAKRVSDEGELKNRAKDGSIYWVDLIIPV